MRVIIKPGGLIAIVVALASLVVLVYVSKQGGSGKMGSRTAAYGASSSSSASPTGGKAPNPAGNLLHETGWQNYMEETAVSTMTPLSGSDLPARPGYHFVIEKIAKKSWNLGFINNLKDVTLSSGEKLRVRFWAKSTGVVPITVLLQRNAAPFPHAWKQHVTLSNTWKEYTYSFSVAERYEPGESVFAIQFGEATGTMDLAGITLERQ